MRLLHLICLLKNNILNKQASYPALKKELSLESLNDPILQKWLNGEIRFSYDQTIV
jgi:hypothetical protein